MQLRPSSVQPCSSFFLSRPSADRDSALTIKRSSHCLPFLSRVQMPWSWRTIFFSTHVHLNPWWQNRFTFAQPFNSLFFFWAAACLKSTLRLPSWTSPHAWKGKTKSRHTPWKKKTTMANFAVDFEIQTSPYLKDSSSLLLFLAAVGDAGPSVLWTSELWLDKKKEKRSF